MVKKKMASVNMDEMTQVVGTAARKPAATLAGKRTPLFPFVDLKAQFATIKDEVMPAVIAAMESQQFILGPEVLAFEQEVAAYIGARFAVSCASGSDALVLALMALGIGHGDDVVTTPFTFVATAGAIARVGARPVFVDIDEKTYNIDCKLTEQAITPQTRAIIPVHLYGLAANSDRILEIATNHKSTVIEDTAQAIGATYNGKHVGDWGQIGCFSFFPSKNLGGAGDGGLLTTNDHDLSERLKLLRVHGSREKYHYEVIGMNSRLDTLQAAILRVKLRHLDRWAEKRRQNAELYRQLFASKKLDHICKLPFTPANCVHVYNQFVVRCPNRDALRQFLQERGVPTDIYYPVPLHLQAAFAYLGYRPGQLPQAETASKEVLALPIYPELKEAQQHMVVNAIADFYGIS